MRNDIMLSMYAESKEQTLALHSSLDSLLSAFFPVQSSLSIRPASSLFLCIHPQSFLIFPQHSSLHIPHAFPMHSLFPMHVSAELIHLRYIYTNTFCTNLSAETYFGESWKSILFNSWTMQICKCDYASQQLHFGGLREDDIDKRLRHSSPLVSLTTNWIVEMFGSSTLHSD